MMEKSNKDSKKKNIPGNKQKLLDLGRNFVRCATSSTICNQTDGAMDGISTGGLIIHIFGQHKEVSLRQKTILS